MSQRSRNWCFTLNNYSEDDYQRLLAVECVYIVIGKEVGESLTPHLQGFIVNNDARTMTAMRKKICSKCHWEPCKGSVDENYVYCTKDVVFEERGVKPMSQKQKGDGEKERWEEILSLTKSGEHDKLPAEIQFKHAKTIDYVYQKECRKRVLEDTESKMEWYCGATGTGKSRKAREEKGQRRESWSISQDI